MATDTIFRDSSREINADVMWNDVGQKKESDANCSRELLRKLIINKMVKNDVTKNR